MAHLVWERFGDAPNYAEPFFGSGAVLLGRPHAPGIETVNDLDCYLANFWRAVQAAPEEVARWADAPVNEADLHARHLWLVKQEDFRERMKTDPDYFDVKIAGWWVWGICSWIGSGWCARPEWAGRINGAAGYSRGIAAAEGRNARNAGVQMWRKRPALRRGGRGVLGNGLVEKLPNITAGHGNGCGVHSKSLSSQVPQLGGAGGAAGRGVHASAKTSAAIVEWMLLLSDRLRRVRVCCGDWRRILGRCSTECVGTTAVFLDPPYNSDRDKGCYREDSMEVSGEVRAWALEQGAKPAFRIALCGYEGEHEMPGWDCLAWKANGGFGNSGKGGRGRANAARERIWFSPHCLHPASPELFSR